MKASEFIQRIQELIDANGDVEVVIESRIEDDGSVLFEKAAVEPQSVILHPLGSYVCMEKGNDQVVIKVW